MIRVDEEGKECKDLDAVHAEHRHGFGAIRYENGDTYEGDWVDNKIQGLGKYTWYKNGNEVLKWYIGDWE